MSFWTYRFEFEHAGHRFRVEASVGLQEQRSRLYRDAELIEEQALLFAAGYRNPVFAVALPAESASQEPLRVELGYRGWLGMGVAATHGGRTVYESHPGADIRFAEKQAMLKAMPRQSNEQAQAALQRWQRNKYSMYADIALGAVFFVVGKLTGDLTTAALVGAAAGLALVLIQRFVRVDLLGGFAVFGTIMLLISAAFSLAFQSDYMVQMKSTVLGVLTAVLFFGDGLLRGGAYFGRRMQRYMPSPINAARMALGLGLTGLLMAGMNFAVARWMSESAWLNYTTFVDTPLSIGLVLAVYNWAKHDPDEPV